MNSRSIPQEVWEHARQCLVFYFSRRFCISEAEDLAQETLLTLWNRENYEFEKAEDFPRICYAFAGRILKARYRKAQKESFEELDLSLAGPVHELKGLKGADLRIFAEEVRKLGESRLNNRDWNLIEHAAGAAPPSADRTRKEASRLRVSLHRARKKLGELTGWRNQQV